MIFINFSLVVFFFVSFGLTRDFDGLGPDIVLPSYITVTCTGNDLDVDGRISTMARLMDWCYCGNTVNPGNLKYAGMSVHEDSANVVNRKPMRTWVCSKYRNDPCDDFDQWYTALGNVTSKCDNKSGFYYDSQLGMAWGFETNDQTAYCDNVPWT